MNKIQQPWMEKGYRTFAYEGPQGLKVERLAKEVGKSKSSFYHHFADLEVFTSVLLDYHLKQADLLAEKESNCKTIEELIDVLVDHKVDLLFNRQLRVHRANPEFCSCLMETGKVTTQAIIGLWAEALELKDQTYLAGLVLKLSLENFLPPNHR
jgi:AcrR family transcriptional regulator